MAGSYRHCEGHNVLRGTKEFSFDLIENMGDAHEACEMMFFMIEFLSDGDDFEITAAEDAYYAAVQQRGYI